MTLTYGTPFNLRRHLTAFAAPMPRAHEPNPYLMPSEAARMLGVTSRTLSRWVDRGLLACTTTLGGHRRYLEADVQALLRKLQEDDR